MEIAILSRERDNCSTGRLREAVITRGHQVKVLDTLRFDADLVPAGKKGELKEVEPLESGIPLSTGADLD